MAYYTRQIGDPTWIRARYPGQCSRCKTTIKRGDNILYYPRTKSVLCNAEGCGKDAYREFTAAAEAEEFGGFSTY